MECDFDEEAGLALGGGNGFRLHQCGRLADMREWQYKGLRGPFWRVYHHVDPGSAIVTGGKRLPLAPGELVLIPENTTFDARGAAGVAHHWFHFSPPVASPPGRDGAVIRLPLDRALGGIVEAWRETLVRHRADAARGDRRRLFHATLAVLHACLARMPQAEGEGVDRALRRVLEEIERTLPAPPGNAALARLAGRGVEGFIRWFRAGTGTTPARYGTERRVREASRLLTLTDRSIDEIAGALGFANRHHFTRVFTRHAGQAPARFRAEQRQA